jgi:TetR/AcrR family transcriptional regulator
MVPPRVYAMDAQKLTRREREKLAQREEILATALNLFSKHGYRNVSMHEIAQATEFAVGTLYKFFKNKEDLYQALMLGLAQKFDAALRCALESAEEESEKLRRYVRVKGELFATHAHAIRLYLAETHGASFTIMAGLDSELRRMHEDFIQTLASIIERGMRKKTFKRIGIPYHLALALDSITNAFLFLSIEQPDTHPYPDNPDTIVNLLFKGLVA